MNIEKNVPKHVAIIMDGNGRWAEKRFMPRTAGHAKGATSVRAVVECCVQSGVKNLTLFAFSTENWRRPADEVSTLMGLFVFFLEKEMAALADAGVCLKIIGDVSAFSEELQKRIKVAETLTQNNKCITLCVAANYGGRWDMLQAVKNWALSHPKESLSALTEEKLTENLSTADLPEVDLLIRTGGEQRISNFMLWQIAYAELYFTKTLWPDFGVNEFKSAIEHYEKRDRRYGGVSNAING